jgi:hypothetical protein
MITFYNALHTPNTSHLAPYMAPTPDALIPRILRLIMSIVIPPVSLTAAISSMTFKEVTVGSGSSAVKISLAEVPTYTTSAASSNGVTLKSVALRSNLEALRAHAATHATAELLSPLREVHGCSSTVIEQEAAASADVITAAFLDPDLATIVATAFLTPDLKEIIAEEDVADRFKHGRQQLRYVRASSTLDPSSIDNRISPGLVTVAFILGLPQSARVHDPAVQDLGSLLTNFHQSIRSVVTPSGAQRQHAIDDSGQPNFTYAGEMNFFENKSALEHNIAMPDNLELFSIANIKEGKTLPRSLCFQFSV